MGNFLDTVVSWIKTTHIQQQIADVDVALFTNPWFMVPFVALLMYLIYKQAFKDLIIILIFVAVWWASGLEYMQTLIVDGELNIQKILPVVFGGAAVLGLVIYLIFGRSD